MGRKESKQTNKQTKDRYSQDEAKILFNISVISLQDRVEVSVGKHFDKLKRRLEVDQE